MQRTMVFLWGGGGRCKPIARRTWGAAVVEGLPCTGPGGVVNWPGVDPGIAEC
jgi:hypothetical protein